ncbi:MAG: helix-turn-helix domain-containing protein [Lachnospiraceae bacterium]|nr:helix-turn-helix domain-containing protein [Lachnospiraceae bacterium]
MIRKKIPLSISGKDLAELYTYLALFGNVYDGYDTEIEALRNAIEEIYAEANRCNDAEYALNKLRNPREAGRKQTCSPQQIKQIREMRRCGMSIRRIAEESGMSKSSVQRWLRK